MPPLLGPGTRVVVQGITGFEGSFHTRLMIDYGTRIMAGVTPGKGGTTFNGVPVYDTVEEACASHNATASVIFVPAAHAKDAALESITLGLSPVVVITEGLPIRDAIEIVDEAKHRGIAVVGPNTPGVIAPGVCKLGIMPANVFQKGKVGVISRSGTLTYEIASGLTRSGIGQSICIGIGGDPITGLNFVEVLEMLKNDNDTIAVVLIGEIGGNAEELAAEYIVSQNFGKPVVSFIAGRAAPSGRRMGHAGAIITGRTGTAESKIQALRNAGVKVAMKPSEIASLLRNSIKN